MKYLKLNFRNAGFFTVHKNTKDYVFDLNGQRKRVDVFLGKQQKVSISVNQVSNMLHVLMGERPSATYRDTYIKRIEEIFNVANNSYIKIDNVSFINNTNNKKFYQSETITTRKSVWNSFSTAPDLVYWQRVKNLLTDEDDYSLFTQMIITFNNILRYDVLKKPAHEVFETLKQNHKDNQDLTELKTILQSKNKTPIIKLLEGGYIAGFTMNSNPRTMLTTNFGVDKITRLSGSMIIPNEDTHVDKIKNSKGDAT